VAVLNPSPFARAGLVDLDLAVPDDWDEVALELADGRLVATQELTRSPALFHSETRPGGRLTDLFRRIHGRELYNREINGIRVERDGGHRLVVEVDDHPDPPHLDMDELRAEVETAAAAAPEADWEVLVVAPPRRRLQAAVPVPALGWTAVAARPGRGTLPPPMAAGGADKEAAADPVVAGPGRLGNGLVTVAVAADGTLSVRAGEVALDGVGRVVDGGDAGDLYNHAPPEPDPLVEEPQRVEVTPMAGGPVRGELAVRRVYRWPVGLDAAATARSGRQAAAEVAMRVELRAGEPLVRLRVAVDNPCRDHRVRLHVPLPGPADRSMAEGQFAVVERGTAAEGGHGEVPLPTFPASGFVDAGGVAVLLDHVTEYELLTDPPVLALTLLRSVGQISRDHHRYREEPAGPQTPTPGAQCLGTTVTDLALFPHPGAWHEDGVLTAMECFRHGFLAAPGGGPPASGPPLRGLEGDGLEVDGEGVVLSALRRRGDWLELRLARQHPSPATTTVRGRLVAAREADLLGRPGPDLPVAGGAVRLELRAWEIRTIQLRREDP
jgi:mannosylglycerate hydrolase